jgi:hypothetical protein
MSFRLMGVAVAAASTLAITPASAGCWSCGCSGYTYVQPRVVYVQPCAAYQRPVYVVNQGPTYTQPVPPEAMPSPYVKHRERPYPYGAGVPRWHHHYKHHRRMHGHFYRAPRRALVAPLYRPYRDHAGPRIVHVPKRLVMPYRARPIYAPMHPRVRHPHDPKHPAYAPRPRHHQP